MVSSLLLDSQTKKAQSGFSQRLSLVKKDLENEYVKGTIFTKQNLLKFYYDGEIIKTYKYKANKR